MSKMPSQKEPESGSGAMLLDGAEELLAFMLMRQHLLLRICSCNSIRPCALLACSMLHHLLFLKAIVLKMSLYKLFVFFIHLVHSSKRSSFTDSHVFKLMLAPAL
jgi:hypothetical protein